MVNFVVDPDVIEPNVGHRNLGMPFYQRGHPKSKA
jgi:hypothetical protein